MKIKHWQGYGKIEAKLISKDKEKIIIEVKGNHEYGLETNDKYTIKNWLVDKFCKTLKDISAYKLIKKIELYDHYIEENNLDVEVCRYTIYFN